MQRKESKNILRILKTESLVLELISLLCPFTSVLTRSSSLFQSLSSILHVPTNFMELKMHHIILNKKNRDENVWLVPYRQCCKDIQASQHCTTFKDQANFLSTKIQCCIFKFVKLLLIELLTTHNKKIMKYIDCGISYFFGLQLP